MKKRVFLKLLIFTLFIILPSVNCVSVLAKDKDDYVSIEEEEVFIWNTDYDEDEIEKMYADMGYNDTIIEPDDDVNAVKIYVASIDAEEDKFDGYDGVGFDYVISSTENRESNSWDVEEYISSVIYEYTILESEIVEYYQRAAIYGAFFVADDVSWSTVMYELEDDYGGDSSADFDDGEIKIEIDENQIGTNKLIEVNSKYNSDGVLESYELDYDDETIIEAVLEGGVFQGFLIWIIIGLIILIAIIVMVITFVVIFARKSKVKEPKAKVKEPEVKKEETEEIPAAPERVPPAAELEPIEVAAPKFCPYCGSAIKPSTKYCEFCGQNIND
ncbi:MAG: hypothetical protein GF383_11400 [Candidatus Lokiarchaeota archaeon]|nr:hypothetical protein [Candidatus Lokiarchaeota archaeon]MBD3341329.1 hypothetical protein [Candidatus Lokiarchaeota archaeon]